MDIFGAGHIGRIEKIRPDDVPLPYFLANLF